MPEDIPELIYFDGPGRANLTRLILAAGGVQFKDTRHSFSTWPEVKGDPTSAPAQLFGSMPVIKHGDFLLAQSTATATYAAELGIWQQGVLGDGADARRNRATEAMMLATNEDLRATMYKCLFGDDASKAAGKAALPAAAGKILAGVERALGRKTAPGPFFFSQGGPSAADLAVFDNVTSPFPGLRALGVDLGAYPRINALVDAVGKSERIKAHLAKSK